MFGMDCFRYLELVGALVLQPDGLEEVVEAHGGPVEEPLDPLETCPDVLELVECAHLNKKGEYSNLLNCLACF